jgi:CDP-diacylglycerol--glycerol-3-phosphate 3-phosphatidyltransferase
LRPAAAVLVRAGVSPNTITVVGTLGVLAGAVFAARGELVTAIVIVTVSSICDLLDGQVARLGGRASVFGALLDSVLDRVADGALLGALAWWLFSIGDERAAAAALVALVGGQLVPYVRARAEGLGLRGETGFAPRFTRLKLLGVGGVLAAFDVDYGLEVVLWLLAALSYVTAWQRLTYVRAQLRDQAASRPAVD